MITVILTFCGIFDEGMAEKIKEAHGLRNRLIHGYDGADDETACYAINDLIADLKNFSVVVLEWISNGKNSS